MKECFRRPVLEDDRVVIADFWSGKRKQMSLETNQKQQKEGAIVG